MPVIPHLEGGSRRILVWDTKQVSQDKQKFNLSLEYVGKSIGSYQQIK